MEANPTASPRGRRGRSSAMNLSLKKTATWKNPKKPKKKVKMSKTSKSKTPTPDGTPAATFARSSETSSVERVASE